MSTEARLALMAGDRLEYRFCSPEPARGRQPVPLETLLEQARAIDVRRCRRLTFGDAPLSHPDFFTLARACQELGLGRFAIETDGSPLAEASVVERLEASGVETVFVITGGMRRRIYETVMRDHDFARAVEGIQRTAASKMRVYVVVPVLRWTERDLEPLLDYLLEMRPRPTGFLLYPPEVGRVPRELRSILLSHSEQAGIAARLFEVCARHHVEFGFFDKRGLLPCAAAGALSRFGTVFFERMSRLAGVGSSSDARRVTMCADCSLSQSCPGVDAPYLEHFGKAGLEPVPLSVSMDWKLRPINRLDERGVKSVSTFDNDVESHGRSLVRVNGHCNMSCSFCYIDRTVPDFDAAELVRSIDGLASRNLDHLVLSGGEPTLHPELPSLIAHAKSLGFRTIEIQSNGVRSADMGYAKTLADAGLGKVTVSLHSADPEHSDRITRLPGAFGKTMRALHNYRQLGVLTQVAHVITKSNFEELPATVRFLREEFPASGGNLSICFGIAQPISDLVFTWVMPRFSEVEPFMREALDYCLDAGVGFGGMIGQGGYPPCMLGGDLRYYQENLGHIYRSEDHGDQFYKADRCAGCSFDPWCLGVRRYYVDTYGDAELSPFEADVGGIEVPPVPRGGAPRPREQLVTLGRGPAPR
jgi:MoaA/NifB/PqqE/SkfB family radical SAM enzyme